VVNLVFAKPVYSYVKFWQMIGRGTRVLDDDPAMRKAWCREKDRFLILDCWGNFDHFEMNPKGREPGQQIPMPVRLFRARLRQLEAATATGDARAIDRVIRELRASLAALPANNVIVLEHQAELARVADDAFWVRLRSDDVDYLSRGIAPVLRASSGVDFKVLRFEIDVVDLGTALITNNAEAVNALRVAIVEQVSELPLGMNLVARERALIDAVLGDSWWATLSQEGRQDLVTRLGPLMRHRQEGRRPILSLNLSDIAAVRERIEVGPGGRDMSVAEYRRQVEEALRALVAENPVLQRIQAGEHVSTEDLERLARILEGLDPSVSEDRLRRVYDVRRAGFLQLIRHCLGLERLEQWPTFVARRFEEFIAAHTTYTARQIRFLQTLRTFLLQRRRLEKRDLVERPFTQLHPQGVRGVFSREEIDEILGFAGDLVA
jgi:type I restriction enzyme R subunit